MLVLEYKVPIDSYAFYFPKHHCYQFHWIRSVPNWTKKMYRCKLKKKWFFFSINLHKSIYKSKMQKNIFFFSITWHRQFPIPKKKKKKKNVCIYLVNVLKNIPSTVGFSQLLIEWMPFDWHICLLWSNNPMTRIIEKRIPTTEQSKAKPAKKKILIKNNKLK